MKELIKSSISVVVACALLLFFILGTARSEENKLFFEKSSKHWQIFGLKEDPKKETPNMCGMRTRWDDGSEFWVIQDLDGGELQVSLDWKGKNLFANGETGILKMQFFDLPHGKEELISVNYSMVGNQSVQMDGMPQDFFRLLTSYATVRFQPDGTDMVTSIDLSDAGNAVVLLGKCMTALTKLTKKKPEING